jgi:hypothetical protein
MPVVGLQLSALVVYPQVDVGFGLLAVGIGQAGVVRCADAGR